MTRTGGPVQDVYIAGGGSAGGAIPVDLTTRLDAVNDSVNIGSIGGRAPLTELVLLPSTTRNATYNGDEQINTGAKGLVVFFDVTAVPGTDTVTLNIDIKDAVSGKWWNLHTTTPLSTIDARRLEIYPTATGGTQLTSFCSAALPSRWRVRVVHSSNTNFTYSIGAVYLP